MLLLHVTGVLALIITAMAVREMKELLGHEPLDYSHNIFIPMNAYKNYELFMEYADVSDIGRRSGKPPAIPAIDSLPDVGTHTYSAQGVLCQVQLTSEDGKRVLKKTNCAEGLSLKAVIEDILEANNDLADKTAGLVNTDAFLFTKMIFEDDGYTIHGTTGGATLHHFQTKVELSSVAFEIFLTKSYTFQSSKIQITGNQNFNGDNVEVELLKEKDSTIFGVTMTIPQGVQLQEFVTKFVKASLFTGASIVNPLYSLSIESIKQVDFAGSAKGIFNPSTKEFQLTAKVTSNDRNAFSGINVDVYAVIHKRTAGSLESFALALGYPKTTQVKTVIGNFVKSSTAAFQNKMITNILGKWFLIFSSDEIPVYNEERYSSLFSEMFESSETKAFTKGLGLKVPVRLKQTLETCKPGSQVSELLNSVKIFGILKYGKGLHFKYPEKKEVPLEPVVACSDDSISSRIPDPLTLLEQKTNFKMEQLSYDIDSGNFKVVFGYAPKLVILENILEFENSKLEISKDQDEEDESKYIWTYKISSKLVIFGMNATVSVQYSDSTVTAEVFSENVPLTEFLKVFTLGMEPPFTFEIHDFKMQVEWTTGADAKDKKISVAGKPVINGFNNLTVEAMVWSKDTEQGVAVAVIFTDIRLDEVLSKVLGIEDIPMAWFSKMQLVAAVSNVEAEGCDNPAQDEDACEESEEEEEESSDESSSDDAGDGGERKKKLKTKKEKKLTSKITKKDKKKLSLKKNKSKKVKKNKKDKGKGRKNKRTENKQKRSNVKRKVLSPGMKQLNKQAQKRFSLDTLSTLDLVQGVYIKASFFMPDDCKKDALCEWMKTKISASTKLYLEGTFSTDGVTLEAGMEGEITLSEDLFLTGASLKLSLTTEEKSVELKCSLKYTNKDLSPDPLEFFGAISVSFSGKLEIRMAMKGIIREPFGIASFAFGNLNLAIGITIAGGIPSFQIGCQVQIGNVNKEEGGGGIFIFEGYFGFDPTDPTNNYVYARSSGDDLTLINILKNFGISQNPSLPQPIAESGFIGELVVSFSAQGKDIDDLGIKIKPGFYLKGGLRILDLEIYAEINVNTDPESLSIFANITATPINWVGGLLRIQRSKTDNQNGPYVIVDISADKTRLEVEGFASCLGISAGIKVTFNDTHSYFFIEGDIYTVLRANLTVAAAYGGTLAEQSYSFEGCVSYDLDRIAKVIYDALADASRAVSQAMEKAREKVREAKAAVTRAFAKTEEWKAGITNYQNQLKARSAELERKKQALNYDCSERCGKVCIGFLDWNNRCWKVWGHWVGCPKWNPCKWKAPDIICIAGCELKRAWNKFVTWAEQVGIQIMLGITEISKFLLDGVKVFEALAQKVLDFADGFLQGVEGFCNGIMTAVEAVVRATANAIKIDHFCLSGHLKPVESVCVRCWAKLAIVGIPIEWDGELCLDLSFFKAIGQKTAIKHEPSIAMIDKKVQEFTSKGEEVTEEKENMEKEEEKQGEEVNEKTKDVPDTSTVGRRRTHVPTKEEIYYFDLAYGRIPEPDIRSFKTEESMRVGAPWILSTNWIRESRIMIPDDTTANKRVLSINVQNDCKRLENVHSNYETIAEGFNSFFRGMQAQKAGFYKMKRGYIQGMDYVKNEFNYGDRKFNITFEEREHVKYWHDYVINGLTDHLVNTEKTLKAERKTYIPTFRNHVNHIIGQQTNKNLSEYVDQLHGAVMKSYSKRSDIPLPLLSKRSMKWEAIRKTFKELANDETSTIREFGAKFEKVNHLLEDLRRSEIPCAK